MAEPKWTPGPWQANLHHTVQQAGRTYCFIHHNSVVPIATITLGVEGCDQDEGRANGHLIAAAPDMAEALAAFNLTEEMIVSGTADALTLSVPLATIRKAAAALAKASGETVSGTKSQKVGSS